jgi:tight adherence protein C
MLDPLGILVSLIVFAAVFLLVFSLFRAPEAMLPAEHRRIAEAVGAGERHTVFEQPMLARIMGLGLQLARRLTVPWLRQLVARNLDAAGNPNGYSINEYLAICVVSAAGLAGVSLLLGILLDNRLLLVLLMLTAAVGFAVPLWVLKDQAARRLTRISMQLPYSLDLISLMMAAGSTFTEAIDTLIKDDRGDDLNQELRIVRAEIDFGTQRNQALRNLAQRIPLDSLRSVVAAVNQAEQLGTPLSNILSSQADMLRNRRSVRAEKLSASASLRILLPTMLIMIAVVLCVFGPFLIRRYTTGTWF